DRKRSKRPLSIYWRAAPGPCFTLNTDGSVKINTGDAVVGGCIRDEDGRVVQAFSANLGKCSITRAEITAIVLGLERAWEAGIRHVEVQTDSICVINLISGMEDLTNQHAAILGRFRSLRNRDWNVQVKHVYREANFLTDHLANNGHVLQLGAHNISVIDTEVNYWARYDLDGGVETRLVRTD
ncbi:Putative ribonuclease H protein At1g65750, partial [Linum perenne]